MNFKRKYTLNMGSLAKKNIHKTILYYKNHLNLSDIYY